MPTSLDFLLAEAHIEDQAEYLVARDGSRALETAREFARSSAQISSGPHALYWHRVALAVTFRQLANAGPAQEPPAPGILPRQS